jgi:hypothetical protein
MKKIRKFIIYISLISLLTTSVLHAEDINQITYTYNENNQ